MKYKGIDISKLNRSAYSLGELIHKYGHEEIIDFYDEDPLDNLETAYVVTARMFEDLNLEHLDIWKQGWKCWKHHRTDLTIEQLSLFFYKAMAEVKQSYIELMEPENERDESQISNITASLENDRTIIKTLTDKVGDVGEAFDLSVYPQDSDNADKRDSTRGKEILNKMGIKSLKTTEEVDGVFWRLAFMGYDIIKPLRDAMFELSCNNQLKDYIDYRCRQFNCQLGIQRELGGRIVKEKPNPIPKPKTKDELSQTIIKLERSINRRKKHEQLLYDSLRRQKDKHLQKEREANKEIIETRRELKHFVTYLKNPTSRFCRAYDFNDESEMDYYLKWFKVAGRTLSYSHANDIAKLRITDENVRQRFFEKVIEVNRQIKESRQL